ncbi:MAG: sterol desaturase family protein [Chitinophagaceae bacterium]|nr:MAG: sterol desaturase family protein [Chitinophagaceae bacterium]
METYGGILLIAMPIFLTLVIAEKIWGWKKGLYTYNNMDTISSLSSGITNVTKDVLGLALSIITYEWMVKHFAIVEIKASIIVYIIAFIVLDFAGYWTHRWQHKINILWNMHVIHHSSEEFNLACALRQSISNLINIFTFLLLPAALLGVPTKVIAIVAPIQLFAQFWYHTRLINKMGFLEHIIVTPSHHRVHHGINKEYIDKNLSQIFIIWDKLFGTFQKELKEAPPVYGITVPAATWNPIKINFQHLWLMMQDAWHTNIVKDKFTLWFKPTGYRPADVIDKYPIPKIDHIYTYQKYNTHPSVLLSLWSFVQLFVTLFFISYLFANIALINAINTYYIYWYGLFIFLQVYAYTELMDNNKNAWIWEYTKNIIAIIFLYQQQQWFGSHQVFSAMPYLVFEYLIISFTISAYFRIQMGRK